MARTIYISGFNKTFPTVNAKLFPTEEQIRSAKILIIDDEQAYIRVLEWALKQSKFSNFRSILESNQACEEFERFRPDIVLLDLLMPEIDGFELMKRFQEKVPEGEFVPVVVLTGQNTAETRSRAVAAGASDFLGKPVDYTELVVRIKNLLQTRLLYQQARQMQTQLESVSGGNGGGNKPKP